MVLLRTRRPRGSCKQRIAFAPSTSQLLNTHATMAASVANAHDHFLNAIFVMPVLNPSFVILFGKNFEHLWALAIANILLAFSAYPDLHILLYASVATTAGGCFATSPCTRCFTITSTR